MKNNFVLTVILFFIPIIGLVPLISLFVSVGDIDDYKWIDDRPSMVYILLTAMAYQAWWVYIVAHFFQ